MADSSFFEESKEQSIVKTTIVQKYFAAWARVMIGTLKRYQRTDRIAYMDLFAGPGRYEDGTHSTPMLILETAVADEELREKLVLIFNDRDPENCRRLEEMIASVPGIEGLKHPPVVVNDTIGPEIAERFQSMTFVPALFFVDPWGYKGLSLTLVNAVIKDWGCDCIFFFNYNRINMGLGNPFVKERMDDLFGADRADKLAVELATLDARGRELLIVEELSQALAQGVGGEPRYVLPFGFKSDSGQRTKHHLIFVSKHFRGYEIMKEIMAGESSAADQGVTSFEYSPADYRYPTLFNLTTPLDELQDRLISAFAGRALAMQEIYEEHSPGTPFTKQNYKDALVRLEEDDRVVADPPAEDRRIRAGKRTFADRVVVNFPPRN